jgi:hypothetical protein
MRIAAMLRRDWATARKNRTCEGQLSRIISTSGECLKPVLPSCIISCFFISNLPFRRRSLIVSLCCRIVLRRARSRDHMVYNFEGLSTLYSQPLLLI